MFFHNARSEIFTTRFRRKLSFFREGEINWAANFGSMRQVEQ